MIGKVKHGAILHNCIDSTIQQIEESGRYTVHLNRSASNFEEHVEIYKDLEKQGKLNKPWYEAVTLGSYHLPRFEWGDVCHAADISVFNNENEVWISGDEIYKLIEPIKKELGFKGGIGIGKRYIHFDVRDYEPKKWRY